mmetsp:Transcript_13155/g.34415  ORF Transcript_13155/g.34415 Transcript_13155/m.34415 type:complete len:221 (-) Transcript_13155:103-765(-)
MRDVGSRHFVTRWDEVKRMNSAVLQRACNLCIAAPHIRYHLVFAHLLQMGNHLVHGYNWPSNCLLAEPFQVIAVRRGVLFEKLLRILSSTGIVELIQPAKFPACQPFSQLLLFRLACRHLLFPIFSSFLLHPLFRISLLLIFLLFFFCYFRALFDSASFFLPLFLLILSLSPLMFAHFSLLFLALSTSLLFLPPILLLLFCALFSLLLQLLEGRKHRLFE